MRDDSPQGPSAPVVADSTVRSILARAEDDARMRVPAARLRFALGDIDRALAEMDDVASRPGSDQQLARELALQYRTAMGRLHEALANTRVEGSKRAAAMLATLADVALGPGDSETAVRFIRAAIAHEPRSAKLRMAEADGLVGSGAFHEARTAILAAIEMSRDDLRYLEAGAALALRAGKYDDAHDLAVRILARDPPSVLGNDVLGHLSLFRGDTAAAFESARALDANGDAVQAAILRCGALAIDRDDAACRREIEWVVSADPNASEAFAWRAELRLRTGDIDGAIADADRAMAASHDPLISAHIVRSLAMMRDPEFSEDRLKYHDSAEWIGAVSAVFPEAAEHVAEGHMPNVIHWIDRVLVAMRGNRTTTPSFVTDGKLVPLRFAAGPRTASRALLNRVATAPTQTLLDALEALAREHPRSGLPRCHRGELLLWLGRWDEARADLERVIREHPRTRWAYVGLAQVDMHVERPDAALATIKRGIEVMDGGTTAAVLAARGEALLRSGLVREAIVDIESSTAAVPSRVSGWMNLALAYEAVGRTEEARTLADRVQRMAMPLLLDVGRTLGADPDAPASPAALQAALVAMRGCRSSGTTMWSIGESPLRVCYPANAQRVDALRASERLAGLASARRSGA